MRSCTISTPRQLLLVDHIKEDEVGGRCDLWEKKNVLRILLGKPGRKKQIGRHRFRWEDNIKMDLKGIR
jgi:hypothetical protein